MATKNEITQRKSAMLRDLREAQLRGEGEISTSPLSQRELSARYELSGRTVSLLLQQLMQEGVLYTVPRVGTFLGRCPVKSTELYLFVTPVSRSNYAYVENIRGIQAGFADHIAQLGGASYALSVDEMNWHLQQGELSEIAGVFLYDISSLVDLLEKSGTQGVVFGSSNKAGSELLIGTVDYDNEDGGMQATRHLLALGHRNIAFMGLHGAQHQSGEFGWSGLRHRGWHHAMQSAGQNTQRLSFLPNVTSPLSQESQKSTAQSVAASIIPVIKKREITAVVAANVSVAQGLMETLQESWIPKEHWPAIVCFDDAPGGASSGISYLRLPWEKIGAEAAQLLWERRRMPEVKTRQHRLVKMNLVPSLTCRPNWALSGLASRQVLQAGKEKSRMNVDILKVAAL